MLTDTTFSGAAHSLLTPFDNIGRESLAIRIGQRLTGDDMVALLEEVHKRRGAVPQSFRVDNGPEFVGKSLDWWAYSN